MRQSLLGAVWRELPADPSDCNRLSRALGISPIIARALVARGVTDDAAARLFLHGGLEDLHDPALMRDMPQAVAILRRAVEARVPIRIYGDYDADGVTATALLVRALGALGARVDYYLPHRVEEGYGLNIPALEQAAREGVRLLVTVDCGISAADELARAAELGLEVVVTDHHEPPAALPPAAAILNPKRPDCPYPFKDLSGVGVAYKLAAALARDLDLRAGAEHAFLDLVAVGTVADVVSLMGENRLLVTHGLGAIQRSRKLGLGALVRAAAIAPPVTAFNVAFGLAPRLNAAGRLDHAQAAVELLLTPDPARARDLAAHVSGLNTQRQDEERRTFESAEQMIRDTVDLERDLAIVLAHAQWHPGVIGIVASRLVERFWRPVALVALSDNTAKGSARGIPGFHVHDALGRCADLFHDFGGHAMAGGFSMAPANLEPLRERLLAHAAETLAPEHLAPTTDLDAWADLADLSPEMCGELAAMAPFGQGNPPPNIAVSEVTVESVETCGKELQHLRLGLRQGDCALRALWFGRGDLAGRLAAGARVDVCGCPEVDEWNGRRSVFLKVRDVAV